MVLGFLIISLVFYLLINPFNSSATIYSNNKNREKYIPKNNLLFKDKKDSKYFQKVKIKEKKFFSHSPFGELSVFDEVFDSEQNRYYILTPGFNVRLPGLNKKK